MIPTIAHIMTIFPSLTQRYSSARFLASLLLALLLASDPGFTQTITGPVAVIDGDTLKMGTRRIRLFGIDAPESRQTCQTARGTDWWCGTEASKAMRAIVEGKHVTCHQQDIDRYNRMVAICEADGRDIGGVLVEQGLAIAYRYFSQRYVPAETSAKRARRGIWSGSFIDPYDWRRAQRR